MPSPRYRTSAYERAANDFYPTPSWVTELLTNTVRLRGTVWEPCAGQGALAKVLAGAGYRVLATDLVAYDECVFPVASGVDALDAPLPPGVRGIVTNPPYDKLLLPKLAEELARIATRAAGAQAAAVAVQQASARTEALARRLAIKVHEHGRISKGDARANFIRSSFRHLFAAACETAAEHSWIIVEENHLAPGTSRP